MDNIIAVDPGSTSMSMVLMSPEGSLLDYVDVESSKGHVDPYHILDTLALWQTSASEMFVEKIGSRPGQGISSTAKFTEAYGLVWGIGLGMGFDVELVQPRKWKKYFNLPSKKTDKYADLEMARALWPELADNVLRLKKNLDRADALLIGEYARREILNLPGRLA